MRIGRLNDFGAFGDEIFLYSMKWGVQFIVLLVKRKLEARQRDRERLEQSCESIDSLLSHWLTLSIGIAASNSVNSAATISQYPRTATVVCCKRASISIEWQDVSR